MMELLAELKDKGICEGFEDIKGNKATDDDWSCGDCIWCWEGDEKGAYKFQCLYHIKDGFIPKSLIQKRMRVHVDECIKRCKEHNGGQRVSDFKDFEVDYCDGCKDPCEGINVVVEFGGLLNLWGVI